MERRKFLGGAAVVGAGVAAGGLATPAIAQGGKDLVIVSTWPRDFPGLGLSAQRLAARIEELSQGALRVQYFAAGERVGAFDVFDEVASGNAQAYIGADYYWKGKHPALSYFTTVPFGMTTPEWTAWIKYKGGQQLWDELGREFGLKALPAGSNGTQMGGWFNKEINSVQDLNGLKFRTVGIGGDVLTKLGVSVISLPGGQIYENLVSGAIDATEWVGPYNDYFLKFYEAAKYYYWPGFHEPGGGISLAFNLPFWEGLSEHDKNIVTAAALEEHANAYEETVAFNGEYLQKLINEHGVELRGFNDEIYDAFGEATQEVFEEMRQHSPLAARIHDDYVAAMREMAEWQSVAEIAFANQRNRVLGIGPGNL